MNEKIQNLEKYMIVRQGHLVAKKFKSEQQAREWGKWNFKGDTNFEVITETDMLIFKQKRRALRSYIPELPDLISINGHEYKRV